MTTDGLWQYSNAGRTWESSWNSEQPQIKYDVASTQTSW